MRWHRAIALVMVASACGEPASPPSEPSEPSERPAISGPSIERAGETVGAPTTVERPATEAPPPPSRLERRGGYVVDVGRTCDGRPALALTTPPGLCVGLVLGSDHAGLDRPFRPRSAIEDPRLDGVLWVIDAGARRSNGGRLYRLDASGEPIALRRIAERLDRPHGAAIGPDGWLYVGEVERIVRFDPAAADPVTTREVVIDGLPTQIPGRDRIRFHPLSSFVFAPDWDLILNRGSSTDHCEESLPEPRCHDEDDGTAAIWRFDHQLAEGRHQWRREPEVVALGLRNSVALVAHRSGTILQAENGTDLPEPDRPHEELNVIEPGHHYGWPYCFDRDARDPRWEHARFACDPRANASYAPPLLLLPPHSAPLSLAYYEGARLPALHGRLLISMHGYRSAGHRIGALAVDARGVPLEGAALEEIVAGWDASENGPRGAPVGLTVLRDGSIVIVEDNNGTMLRLSRDAYGAARAAVSSAEEDERAPELDPLFAALHREVLVPRCAHCHEFLRGEPAAALAAMQRERWLDLEGEHARIWERVRPGASRRMPLDAVLSTGETESIRTWLEAR